MKSSSLIIIVLFAGCGLALAQEPTKGRIYMGDAKDAPAWVWWVSKATAQEPSNGRIYIGLAKDAPEWVWRVPQAAANTNQMAATVSWFRWVESACAQQRADAQKAMLKVEAAHADYLADPRNRMLKPEAGGLQLTRERGIIIAYDPNTLVGLISGQDGKRWPFRFAEWADSGDAAKRGLWVDFVPEAETGYALFVYSLGPFTAKHLELESPR